MPNCNSFVNVPRAAPPNRPAEAQNPQERRNTGPLEIRCLSNVKVVNLGMTRKPYACTIATVPTLSSALQSAEAASWACSGGADETASCTTGSEPARGTPADAAISCGQTLGLRRERQRTWLLTWTSPKDRGSIWMTVPSPATDCGFTGHWPVSRRCGSTPTVPQPPTWFAITKGFRGRRSTRWLTR
jgi:hypothetical protein